MVELFILFKNIDGMLTVLVPVEKISEYWPHELHSSLRGGKLQSLVDDRFVASFDANSTPSVGDYSRQDGNGDLVYTHQQIYLSYRGSLVISG